MYVYVGRSNVLIFLFRQFLDFWKALTELQALRILWNAKQIMGIFFFFFFFFLSLFFNMNTTCLRTTYFLIFLYEYYVILNSMCSFPFHLFDSLGL